MILLPHGGYPLIAATLSTMAFLTTLSHDGCDFARLTGSALDFLPNMYTYTDGNGNQLTYQYPFVELGFYKYRVPVFYEQYQEWQVRYSDECQMYPNSSNVNHNNLLNESESDNGDNGDNGDEIGDADRDRTVARRMDDTQQQNQAQQRQQSGQSSAEEFWSFDFFWKVGSTSHLIGLVLGGAASLFLWVAASCTPLTHLQWKLVGFQLSLTTFFHIASFLWFFNSLCYREDTTCHWFYGANSLIAAVALYAFAAISVFVKYPEPTVVKIVRERVEQDFQRYEYTETTFAPSEFDEASGVHSFASYGNHSSASKSSNPSFSSRGRGGSSGRSGLYGSSYGQHGTLGHQYGSSSRHIGKEHMNVHGSQRMQGSQRRIQRSQRDIIV